MQLAKRLFDVDIEAADGDVPVWDKDVRFFRVNRAGKPKAYFYLDPYSRPAEKRGGAWMDEVVGQSKLVRYLPPTCTAVYTVVYTTSERDSDCTIIL